MGVTQIRQSTLDCPGFPSGDRIMRIWMDPAERMIIAYENNRLAVMFPQGRIPPQIAVLIPAKEMEQKP